MIPTDTTYQSLSNLQTVCLKQNIPFASYRLPLQSEISTFVQHSSTPEKLDSLQNVDQKSGFIVAPFVESTTHATFLLKPDNIFYENDIETEFIEKLNTSFNFTGKHWDNEFTTTPAADFISQVNVAIKAMENGEFLKVVLSKIHIEERKEDFNAPDFFLKLCSTYPHAFVYFIQLPEVGCWMGATPEPLLVIEDERVKTVSLAGTQMVTNIELNSPVWSTKEIEEQEIVTNFVEQTLRSLQIENYSKVGPTNYRAANLLHLKTSFEFSKSDLQNRLGDFINALHPTPSVGGLPKTEAHDFILANEKHDRAYYTGFLGPINIEGETNIFTNLRCLQLFDKQFVLYSGAGITTSSMAKKEWEETDNKMMTMMNVMNS